MHPQAKSAHPGTQQVLINYSCKDKWHKKATANFKVEHTGVRNAGTHLRSSFLVFWYNLCEFHQKWLETKTSFSILPDEKRGKHQGQGKRQVHRTDS